jgi:hypothetical protein
MEAARQALNKPLKGTYGVAIGNAVRTTVDAIPEQTLADLGWCFEQQLAGVSLGWAKPQLDNAVTEMIIPREWPDPGSDFTSPVLAYLSELNLS